MRILHLIPDLSGGGAERQLSYLAPALVRMDYDVHIGYVRDGPYKPELSGVILHKFRVRSNYDPNLFWQIIKVIGDIRPQVIHTWIPQMDILGGIGARIFGIPWIISEPTSATAYGMSWKSVMRTLIAFGAYTIVSNSKGGDDYWNRHLPKSRRYIIPNGLPINKINEVRAALPVELEDAQEPIVLYVGRLVSNNPANKNLGALLKSLAYVRKKKPVIGVLCGEGPQRRELEALRYELGICENVYFTGYLPPESVWALMKKASVFVSLSAYEGCPNTVMEAMACGCPLVLSDISAHREIVDDRSASFANPTNVQQIAETILSSLSDKGASRRRTEIAKQKSEVWSVEKISQFWNYVYREIDG